jgi:hypothetical protein
VPVHSPDTRGFPSSLLAGERILPAAAAAAAASWKLFDFKFIYSSGSLILLFHLPLSLSLRPVI